jgi:hypothetical protein
MRSFFSDMLKAVNHQRTPSPIVASDDHEPLIPSGVLARLGALLLVVFGFAVAAQLLVGQTH